MFFPIGDDQVRGGHFPILSYSFIAINIVIFWYQLQTPGNLIEFAAIPAKIMQGQDYFTLVTSAFLHGGWMHLIGNMLFLWVFADNIEATVGSFVFLIFYTLGILAAHAAHIYTDPSSMIPTVGASGAISAVMGAYLVMFPQSRVKILFIVFTFRVSAFIFLGIWIWQQWAAGMDSLQNVSQEGGTAWWAHIGGFVFGVVAGLYFRTTYKPTLDRKK